MNNSLINYTGVCYYDVYIDGIYDKSVEINNILTKGGQYCILHAISNSNDSRINKVIFGGGTISKDFTNTIGTFVNPYYKEISFVKPTSSTISNLSLICNWQLEVSDYNGNTISELGLSFIDNYGNQDLFCRVTISNANIIHKTSNIVLYGYWTITVTES